MSNIPTQTRTIDPYASYHSNIVSRLTRVLTKGKNCVLDKDSLRASIVDSTNVTLSKGFAVKDDILIEIESDFDIDFTDSDFYRSGSTPLNESGYYHICLEYVYDKTKPPPEAKIRILKPSEESHLSDSKYVYLNTVEVYEDGSGDYVIDEDKVYDENPDDPDEYYRVIVYTPDAADILPDQDGQDGKVLKTDGEEAYWGSDSVIMVPNEYRFDNESERDNYFSDNPDELVDDLYILVDSQLQRWDDDEGEWVDEYQVVVGPEGETGDDGVSLEYDWDNTSLGVKREDESSYEYVDLQGSRGDDGVVGNWKGEWSSEDTPYDKFDVVEYEDKNWVSLEDDNSDSPTGSSKWRPFVGGLDRDHDEIELDTIGETEAFFDDDNLIEEVVQHLPDDVVLKDVLWNYEGYVLSNKKYRSTDGGSNFYLNGETIVSYNTNKDISGFVWWTDKESEDYTELIQAYFHSGLRVKKDTDWDTMTESDSIMDTLTDTEDSMKVLVTSEDGKEPMASTENSMNYISNSPIARTEVAFDTVLYNEIATRDMAIGKLVAGHAGIDPFEVDDIQGLLSDGTNVEEILVSTNSLKAIDNSELAVDEAAKEETFTSQLSSNEDALDYTLDSTSFVEAFVMYESACENLILTDLSRGMIYDREMAFDRFINNTTPMTIIAENEDPTEDLISDTDLVSKVYDNSDARNIAFDHTVFMNQLVEDEPALDLLVDHEDAISDIVDINTAMEIVTSTELSIEKFVQNDMPMEYMIHSSVSNYWIRESTTAINTLYDHDPTTVPTLDSSTSDLSESSYYSGYDSYRAFDDDDSTSWRTDFENVTDEWISYDFGEPVWCFGIKILPPGTTMAPRNAKMQYFDEDSLEWKDTDYEFEVGAYNSTQEYRICHPVKANRWRLFIMDNHGHDSHIEIFKLQFYCQKGAE